MASSSSLIFAPPHNHPFFTSSPFRASASPPPPNPTTTPPSHRKPSSPPRFPPLLRLSALSSLLLASFGDLPRPHPAAAPPALPLAAAAYPWEHVQRLQEPQRGSCATCVGVVDETLGSCGAVRNCVSTFDDRPDFFIAPWEFSGKLPTAFDELKKALLEQGAAIRQQGDRYIYAVFSGKEGMIDDVEFLFSFPSEDATVNIRAASRAIEFRDNGRNQKRLERIRQAIGWEEVPILRNRKRALFFLESPWDSFGPEPPPVFYYKNGLDFVPD